MSPRPAASRHDASARVFLDAAASLIDAAMSAGADVPPRLKSIKFPAALEWIRIEDVMRLTDGTPGASKKAFRQRWQTRDEFVADAAAYTLQFRDRPENEYASLTDRTPGLDREHLGDAVAGLAADMLTYAESQPRSYVMLHLGSVMNRHPDIRQALAEGWEPSRQPFIGGYLALLEALGASFRPPWTAPAFDRSMNALADGFLLQGRIYAEEPDADAWTHVDLFAETVVAFTLGVLDFDHTAVSARDALSSAARRDDPGDRGDLGEGQRGR